MGRSVLGRMTVAVAVVVVACGGVAAVQAQAANGLPHVTPYSPTGQYAEGASLVSGRLVQPVGRRTTLGDFPVASAVSPDGRVVVVADSGQGEGAPEQGDEALQVIDPRTGEVVQTVRDHEPGKPTFYESGLAFSRDGLHLYATGGGNDQVYDYAVSGGRLRLLHRWATSARAGAPTVGGTRIGGIPGSAPMVGDAAAYSRGLALLPDGSAVLVSNEQGSTLAAVSTTDGTLKWETTLGGPGQPGGAYPEAVTVNHSGTTAYVAAQGLNAVAAVDTRTGVVRGLAPVGDHPVALALDGPGRHLYVANANDDSVSVLDAIAAVPRVERQLSTHLVPGEANGSTPDAVAVDDRSGRVYVGLAGDNATAVLEDPTHHHSSADPARLVSRGAIPTGAYPTAVAVLRDGMVLTAAAKGLGGAPITDKQQYIVNKRRGLLSAVPRPTARQLADWTARARADLLYPTRANALRPADSPIPDAADAGRSPIKHVMLVVRENRTFDQVFGDLHRPGADVQAAYTEFGARDAQGRTLTPNAHRLADRFGLSQNFYSDGEASIQGHHWTAEGVSSDYTEKSYLHYYSNRNHPYDPTAPIVYPRCGSVFQQLAAQGKSFHNFGELVGLATSQAPTVRPAPGARCATPGGAHDGQSAASFSNTLGANLSLTSVPDTAKEQDIEKELAPLVAADRLPQFLYAVLGNDHTDGTEAGKKTPQAHVATNDLAVGKLIDYLSHTPQWKDTAVFVVEDDSQDGLDHRDGHRNILLAASPWVRPGALSSLHVSQASVLHTIELILGIAPLSSYTQYAAVPYDMFTAHPDPTPYTAVTPTYPMDAKNPSSTPGTAASVPLDLRVADVAGPVLEAQIWEATRPGTPMPPALLEELATRGGMRQQALDAWAHGRPCGCSPLEPGLAVAPGEGD